MNSEMTAWKGGKAYGRIQSAQSLLKWRKVLNAKRQRIAELETRNAALMLNEYEGERMASHLARDFDEMAERIKQLEAANAKLREQLARVVYLDDRDAETIEADDRLCQMLEDALVYEADRSAAVKRG